MNEHELILALENEDAFARLVTSIDSLINIAQQFPQHAETLIQKILTSDAEFRLLVTEALLLVRVARQFPQHAEALFQKSQILTSDAEFTRLMLSNAELIFTAKQFPQHAEALIQKALSDPKGILNFIRSDDELSRIKPFCPHIKAIQTATSYEDAHQKLKEQAYKTGMEAGFSAFFRDHDQTQGAVTHLAKEYSGNVEMPLKPPQP